jgi:eukaryotic-like serine/threonine-protein kinase
MIAAMGASTGGELDNTVDVCVALLGSMAQTIAARPHSTVAPTDAVQAERLAALARELAVGGVTIESPIGEGGMGVVYLGTQRALRRKVAVKMVQPAERGPLATAKLLREAWITGSLEHPNVLPVYDAHLGPDGTPRVVLKRIDGVPWRELLHDAETVRRRFGADDLLEHNLAIFGQVCRAVHFAHRRGIIHRDLKPDNVMIGEFGEVYLLDWGIALSLNDEDGALGLAAAGDLAGTPAYMAPEMLYAEIAEPSARTDVYLLGGILHEIITGAPPHDGPSARAIVRSILASSPNFPEHTPGELAAIARRALAADPLARFDSAEQLRIATQAFVQHRASARLARDSEQALVALKNAARTAESAPARAELMRLFGACRFGFGEALAMWPDNPAAQAGLAGAYEAMIAHEADRGEPEAAAALLAELDDAPDELCARVEAAELRKAEELRRVAELERVGRLFDPSSEIRARWITTALLGLLGTIIPLITSQLIDPQSEGYGPTFVLPSCFLVAAVGAAVYKREALARSAHTRWVLATVITALASQLLVHAGCAMMHLPVVASMAMVALLWSALAALMAVIVDRRIATMACGYLAAFVAIATLAHTRRDTTYILSASHLVTTLTVFTIWRPTRIPARSSAAP